MLSLYNKYILPILIDRSMRPVDFAGTRQSVVAGVSGEVLEIGFGGGYNIPFYSRVGKLYALEPSKELFAMAKERITRAPFPIVPLLCPAESIPLADSKLDYVVSTWTLCSVSDLDKVLSEIKRVLKPGGALHFVEHGVSPKAFPALLQKIFTPCNRLFRGNCHLDRAFDVSFRQAGFNVSSIQVVPEVGRPLMVSYRGIVSKSE